MKVPKARKLDSGSWFIQLRLGGESIPVTAPSEKDCIKQAGLVKAEYLAGKRKPSEAPAEKLPTLGEAIDTYIETRQNILSPSTIRGYKTIRKNRFRDYMDVSLSDIDRAEWIEICNKEAVLCSAKTLKNAWHFVTTVIREITQKEPAKVSLPQVVSNERPFLDPTQIKAFVKAVEGTEVEIPALLALSSLRRSEICALRWENIDLKKRCIQVKGAAVFNEDQKLVQKKENKNKSSARFVPIMIDELYVALDKKKQNVGFVVTCNPNTIWSRINRICERNALPKVGVHGLRHSFASLAYHLGVPEKIAMEIGGWSDNQTMRKIYTHVAKSDMERYETKLTEFFKNANENANE